MLWTPEGFYDASPADGTTPSGEDLIGYHLNRGKDREGEFIRAAQLRDQFYNPALITARLGPNGDQLMADAVKQLGNVETLLANARNVPPVVKLLSPERVEAEEETEVRFEVQARGGGVGALKFYVDGQPVDARHMGVGPGETGSRRFKLAPGAHVIEVAGASKDGVEGPRVAVKAVFSGKKTRGTLHLLAIGVERYEDKALTLKHSVRDAEQVAAEIAQRARPLFDNVAPPIVLKDDKATLAGITQAFDQMRARFGPEDTLVIFLAGHGQARVGQFAFLPSDARRSADGALVNGLDETRLFQMLDRSPSHTLLLIDACDAGGMVELFEGAYERMGNVKKRAVIGASRRGQFALEGFEGHGVFTAALLQSLGKTDGGEDLIVPTLYGEVKSSVTRISKQLKGGYQQEVKGYLGTADFAVIRR